MAISQNTEITGVQRLKTRPQFLFVRQGCADRRKSLVVQARERHDASDHVGIGYTTTRKIGNAVIRNKARRRLREASRLLLPHYATPGVDYVFIARLETATVGWQRLLDDMENALISVAQQFKGRLQGPPP